MAGQNCKGGLAWQGLVRMARAGQNGKGRLKLQGQVKMVRAS